MDGIDTQHLADLRRRRRYHRSRLMPYRAELVKLKRDGRSLSEMVDWLAKRRIRVERSTVLRALRSWAEAM